MGRLERTLSWWVWLLLVPVGLGLSAAAGVVSRSDQIDSSTADVLPAAVAGALVALALGVAVVWALRTHPLVTTLGSATALVVIVATGTLLAVTIATHPALDVPAGSDVADEQEATVTEGRTAPSTAGIGTGRGDRDSIDITDFQGSIVLLVGLVLLVAAAVFLMRRTELRAVERTAVYLRSDLMLDDEGPDSAPTDTAIAGALERSLVELLAHADPRMAIRAAYGTLLEELAAIGLRRHEYEGPAEHIRRCLERQPTDQTVTRLPADSISELLQLFEIARFSEREVTDAHADRARHLLASAAGAMGGVDA